MSGLTREQQELLETYGFDLLVQVEAMLRHVREYQRALQRFRGTLPRQQSNDPTDTPLAVMRDHVRALRAALTEYGICLAEIEEHTAQSQNDERREQTDGRLVRPDPTTWRGTPNERQRPGDDSSS